MILVLLAVSHIWRRCPWRGTIELLLACRGLLRRGVVVAMVIHMILLTWIGHIEGCREEEEGDEVWIEARERLAVDGSGR